MKIAIVNNYPQGRGRVALKRIEASLRKLGVKPVTVRPEECFRGGYEAFILTGTMASGVLDFRRVMDEVVLIRGIDLPILGICFGLHVIARSFQIPLVRLSLRRLGFRELIIQVKDPLLQDLKRPLVWENHKVAVSEAIYKDGRFLVLASSIDNPVEVVKVKDRMVYGVQFHPERYDERRPWGFTILKNFIEMI